MNEKKRERKRVNVIYTNQSFSVKFLSTKFKPKRQTIRNYFPLQSGWENFDAHLWLTQCTESKTCTE